MALEQYQKFKSTVEISFVTLEKLVVEKGLNKMDYLEMLEMIPRVSPDPDAERPMVKPPAKILWKCPGRPRKDGTAAQPRFFKMKPKIQPVYDSDSYKSNSSDENYCRRSDNEEWNPDIKNVSVNKREKKYKTKQNSVLNKTGSGKRGRPRKVLDDTTQVLKERKTDPKPKTQPNGILTKSDQFNGNHTKMFVKRPRGRPPKTDTNPEQRSNKHLFPLSVKQEAIRNDSNKSNSGINHKKGRGRPRKIDSALKLEITKKLKARTKPTTIKSTIKKKRGRPKKTSVVLGGGVSKKTTNNRRKRRNPNMDKSVEWSTDTEEEVKVKEEVSSDSDTMTEDLEVRPNNYKSFILAS